MSAAKPEADMTALDAARKRYDTAVFPAEADAEFVALCGLIVSQFTERVTSSLRGAYGVRVTTRDDCPITAVAFERDGELVGSIVNLALPPSDRDKWHSQAHMLATELEMERGRYIPIIERVEALRVSYVLSEGQAINDTVDRVLAIIDELAARKLNT